MTASRWSQARRVYDREKNRQHLWLWDFPSLQRELETAGFSQIRRARFGDSAEPMFAIVEDESRWTAAVDIECVA